MTPVSLNPWNAGSVYIRGSNSAIAVLAEARPSACTSLTIKLDIFFPNFHRKTWSVFAFHIMTSVQVTAEISLNLLVLRMLTHWGRVTHICTSKLTIIDSDNGLVHERCQTIIWSNVGILLIGTLGTNFSELLSEIHTFSFKKMHFKTSSAKWRPFYLCAKNGRVDETDWTAMLVINDHTYLDWYKLYT